MFSSLSVKLGECGLGCFCNQQFNCMQKYTPNLTKDTAIYQKAGIYQLKFNTRDGSYIKGWKMEIRVQRPVDSVVIFGVQARITLIRVDKDIGCALFKGTVPAFVWKETRVRNELFGSSLLLANSPMSPKIVNGSFAAIFDNGDQELSQLRLQVKDSPAVRRRIRGMMVSGKQLSLDSSLDMAHSLAARAGMRPHSEPSAADHLPEEEDSDEVNDMPKLCAKCGHVIKE